MPGPDAPVRDLTGAYALDALDDDELRGFLAYLETDEDARTEAIQLVDTAALLGAAVSAVPPPPGLRTRMLALTEVASSPDRRSHAPASRPVVALPTRRGRWIPVLAAAASVAVLATGGIVLGSLGGAPSGVDRLRAASDLHQARAHADGGGTAEVLWSPSERRAAVALHGLPALSGKRVYELWYIDAVGLATRAGVVRPGGADTATMLEGRLDRGDTIGITVEPRGGSDAPTTTPILEVDTA